jgi:hypothetical protein
MRKLLPFLFLLGCGSDEPPPEVEPVPRIDLVTFPDGQDVRQGGTIRVVVEGEHLERLAPAIDAASPSRASLGEWTVTIDPGSPLGPRPLTLGTHLETVTVVETVVDPVHGHDDQAGIAGAPLRSLERALGLAVPGDHLVLAAGTYELRDFAYVADQVVVRGAGVGLTTLVFPDCGVAATCFLVAGELSHLTVRSQIDRALSVTGFLHDVEVVGGGRGVRLGEGGRLERAVVSGAGRGLELLGAGIAVADVAIDESSEAGIVVLALGGPTSATLDAVTVEDSGTGILVAPFGETTTLTVRRSTLRQNDLGVRLVETGALVDFGTATVPGENAFEDNELAIRDERPARLDDDGPIASFVGTTFDGVDPDGLMSAPQMLPVYVITGANNRLQF